jgi:hypothetical protein
LKVWFVVVDGRRPETAVGMSHHELAVFMQRLGCTDALNMDGGGSSTLYTKSRWESVECLGTSVSWQLQLTVGNNLNPYAELLSISMIYEEGHGI